MDNERSILITGCSSGIGYHAAGYLRDRGWRVLATCRKPEDVARLTAEGFESFPLDLADDTSVRDGAAEALLRTDGRLFALFNNGAFAVPGAAEDLPRDALRLIYETNLFGQVDLTNRILPAMHKAGRGRIINNSSILGLVSLRYRAAYVSTKFALEGITDSYRLENRTPDVHHILIEPGPVTSMIRQKSQPHFERFITPDTSVNRDVYDTIVKPRLYAPAGKPDRFELPPEAVSAKLFDALTRKTPRRRYFVTTPTYIANIMRRVLPTTALDWIARRIG